MRRHATAGVAALLSFSLMAGATGSAAVPAPAVSAVMTDEQQLLALFAQLDESLANVRDDPYLSDTLDASGAMPEASIDHAVDLIASLTPDQLSVASDVLDATPALAEIPAAIDDAVAAAAEFTPDAVAAPASANDTLRWLQGAPAASRHGLVAAPAAVQSATYTDDCPSAGDPAALIIAVLVLNQLQSAAYAAVLAVPGTFAVIGFSIPNPVKIVLAVVYGVALAVYLALAQTLAVASDCAAAAGSEELRLGWPVAGPTSVDPPPGSPVSGSSQITVDEALATVGDITTLLNSVSTNVALVADQVTILGNQATALNTVLSCTSGSPPSAPAATCGSGLGQPPPGSDALSAASDARTDVQTTQGDVAILRNTQHVILDKSNEEIDALAALADLEIRTEIGANLSAPGFKAVALFQLPAPNGYLDIVAEVTTQAVQAFGGGERELARANDAAAAGAYKDAYKLYHQAYQGALK